MSRGGPGGDAEFVPGPPFARLVLGFFPLGFGEREEPVPGGIDGDQLAEAGDVSGGPEPVEGDEELFSRLDGPKRMPNRLEASGRRAARRRRTPARA